MKTRKWIMCVILLAAFSIFFAGCTISDPNEPLVGKWHHVNDLGWDDVWQLNADLSYSFGSDTGGMFGLEIVYSGTWQKSSNETSITFTPTQSGSSPVTYLYAMTADHNKLTFSTHHDGLVWDLTRVF